MIGKPMALAPDRPLDVKDSCMFRAVADQCAVGIVIQRDERLIYANQAALDCLGLSSIDDLPNRSLDRLFDADSYATLRPSLSKVVPDDDQMFIGDLKLRRLDERMVEAEVYHIGVPGDADASGASMINFRDVTMLRKMETDLRQAQKLESVGRLAAGVAHEINTPVQFVSDSLHFVRDAMKDLSTVLDKYQVLQQAVVAGEPCVEASSDVSDTVTSVDLDYLRENVPPALERALDGLSRVTTIVRSLKEFAHPDQKEMMAVDLNQSIMTTLAIARNEYKYLATVDTELGSLPPVMCHGGDVNQVILNLIVNAAHAIEDVVRRTGQRGIITISSKQTGEDILVEIGDTGGGIPPAIQDKVFEPFFTTKPIGRGSGQGLAIARAAIVGKHGGTLSFQSQPGAGTVFRIRLPVAGKPAV
jgi:signal transduction histidine kinase